MNKIRYNVVAFPLALTHKTTTATKHTDRHILNQSLALRRPEMDISVENSKTIFYDQYLSLYVVQARK